MLYEAHIHCPYCGEPLALMVDASSGDARMVEDCQVCCRPIELAVGVGPDGEVTVTAATDNDA